MRLAVLCRLGPVQQRRETRGIDELTLHEIDHQGAGPVGGGIAEQLSHLRAGRDVELTMHGHHPYPADDLRSRLEPSHAYYLFVEKDPSCRSAARLALPFGTVHGNAPDMTTDPGHYRGRCRRAK